MNLLYIICLAKLLLARANYDKILIFDCVPLGIAPPDLQLRGDTNEIVAVPKVFFIKSTKYQ